MWWTTMAATSSLSGGSMWLWFSEQTTPSSMTDWPRGLHHIILNLCSVVCVSRGYSGQKLTDNVQCEIFQTILEEARDSYDHSIVHELPSNTPENFEQNVETICTLINEFVTVHAH